MFGILDSLPPLFHILDFGLISILNPCNLPYTTSAFGPTPLTADVLYERPPIRTDTSQVFYQSVKDNAAKEQQLALKSLSARSRNLVLI